jgi:hypothetical protein
METSMSTAILTQYVRRCANRALRLVAAMAILASCSQPPGPPRPPPSRPALPDACPLGVADSRVTVEETTDGIALVFVAPHAESDLRERVQAAAKMHGPVGRQGKGHHGRHGIGGHHGLNALNLPASRALVTEVPGGARLSLAPVHASDLETLRTRVRERALRMTSLPCDV